MTEEVTRRIEDFVVTLLLPVFFVYTGLKTNVGLLDRPELWLITIVLIAIAIVGKLAGAAIAARVTGFDWRASAVIGTLMNTRGLTELIVLNLALSAGAISNALFAALVLMAIVTTLMAGPLLKLLDPRNEYGSDIEDEFAEAARLAADEHPELQVPERSILVAPQTDAALGQLIALAEPLARSQPPRELIIARPVRPTRGAGAGVRGGLQTENLQLERASHAINEVRARLAADGVAARGVAFSSVNLGSDLVHIVEREPVDLVLIEGRRRLIGEGVPLGEVSVLLEKTACDVAVLVAREDVPIKIGPEGSVLVPFGGAEHDWAALELGSWLAASTGAPLKLLGAAGQTDEGKSVTRMLADAGLLVQQATGIATEPLVVAGGRNGIVAAAAGAGLLVIGLSDRWRREGLGPTRSEIAKAAPAPVLFVRRGTRPGLFSAKENVTQFKWSMAGTPRIAWWSGHGEARPSRRPRLSRASAPARRSDLRRNGQNGADAGHCAVRRGHRQGSSHQKRPFAHPEQTEPFVKLVRLKAAAIIIHAELDPVRELLDLQGHPASAGMFDHVAQRLLNDPVGHGLGVASQAPLWVELQPDLDGEFTYRCLTVGQRLDRRTQSQIVKCSGSQLGDQVAKLAHLSANVLVRGLRGAAQRGEVIARETRRQDHAHAAQPLQGLVVQLAGPASACLLGRLEAQAQTRGANRARGRDGGGGAGRDGHQQLHVAVCERAPVGAIDSGQHTQRFSPEDQRYEDGRARARHHLLELAPGNRPS